MQPIGPDTVLLLLLVSLIAGWMSGIVTQGGGFGIKINIVISAMGALAGFYLLRAVKGGAPLGMAAAFAAATSGSLLLLFIVGLLRR